MTHYKNELLWYKCWESYSQNSFQPWEGTWEKQKKLSQKTSGKGQDILKNQATWSSDVVSS